MMEVKMSTREFILFLMGCSGSSYSAAAARVAAAAAGDGMYFAGGGFYQWRPARGVWLPMWQP